MLEINNLLGFTATYVETKTKYSPDFNSAFHGRLLDQGFLQSNFSWTSPSACNFSFLCKILSFAACHGFSRRSSLCQDQINSCQWTYLKNNNFFEERIKHFQTKGLRNYPDWKNMAVMPWWWHGGHVSWHGRHDPCHDHGLITMFSMIHTTIMVYSSYFPCFFFKKMKRLSTFSQIVAAIYHYMAHLTCFRGIYASNLASQQN